MLTASALLTACGGGGSSSDDSSSNDISKQKAGIYTGSSMIGTVTGYSVLLITQDADVVLVSDEAEMLFGTASESGAKMNLNTRYYMDGAGSDWGARVTADLTYNNATLSGPYSGFDETGNFSLIRQSDLYERSISLSDFAGTWTDTDGLPYSINNAGIIASVTDPATGCTATGDFELETVGYNEFEMDFTTTGCYDVAMNGEWEGYGFFSDENGTNSVINAGLLKNSGDYFTLVELTKQP
ncbi:hypothetical protein [Oceanospirillum linum]|uniref:hypothetical protein n=1 Tax=Oceanospirillum linum TaxID=966 RepID=UPI001116C5AE|nr:hypothetical protein [Oceanospirillum linum]